MERRILNALVVSLLGTALLYLLGQFLFRGLVGSSWELPFCFIGAWLTTFLFAKKRSSDFRPHVVEAVPIVFGTFFFISLGHALSKIYSRGTPLDFEPIGKFFWATVVTSWWLIPSVAGVLTLLSRVGR